MLTNFKVSLFRFCEVSWDSLKQLKAWMKLCPIRIDGEGFSNPRLQIVQVKDAERTICYGAIEPAYVLNLVAFNPQSTGIEQQWAGAYIENALEVQAAREGATKLFYVVPDNMPSIPGESFIRVVERRIVPTVNAVEESSAVFHATQHLN